MTKDEYMKWLADMQTDISAQPRDGDRDCISRKGVLKLLYDHKTRTSGEVQAEVLQIELEVETIPSLPSVSQPQGHWIHIDDDNLVYDSFWCSECHKSITVDAKRTDDIGFVIDDMKFCPNCGVKMGVSE